MQRVQDHTRLFSCALPEDAFLFILLKTERMTFMKKITLALSLLLALLTVFSACGGEADPWSDATYTEDTTLGTGTKSVTVEVDVNDHLVTFTLKTDADMLGAALLDTGLCTGENGDYGLYIKTTNGIFADYDVNGHYWALYIDGAYAMSGADTTEIVEGSVYRLSYEK